MPLDMEVGLGLGPGDFAFDGDPAPSQEKGHSPRTRLLYHVYCDQTAGWMKTPLGTEVNFGPGHIVLDGDPAPHAKGAQQTPLFGRRLLLPRSPISATAELLLLFVTYPTYKHKQTKRQTTRVKILLPPVQPLIVDNRLL